MHILEHVSISKFQIVKCPTLSLLGCVLKVYSCSPILYPLHQLICEPPSLKGVWLITLPIPSVLLLVVLVHVLPGSSGDNKSCLELVQEYDKVLLP